MPIWSRALPLTRRENIIAAPAAGVVTAEIWPKFRAVYTFLILQRSKWPLKYGGVEAFARSLTLKLGGVEKREGVKVQSIQRICHPYEKDRKGQIGAVDKASLKIEAKIENKSNASKRKEREKAILALTEKCVLSSSSSGENTTPATSQLTSPTREPQMIPGPSNQPPRKRGRRVLINDHLAASLDVAKLSNRKAAIVLTSTLKSAGSDPAAFNINRSSVRRHRLKSRQKIAESLKKEFKSETPLTVHWDGKLIEDITGHETVDRLPILVSGNGVDQLLSVNKLNRGTGEACARAVYETIESWNLCEQIKCMCFNTPAVNTGLKNGACIHLEQKMEKDMLWLACRHHVMEIIWSDIDQADYKAVSSDASSLQTVENIAAYIISFAQDQLNRYQPRDDYKELLNLTIIYLGGIPEKEYHSECQLVFTVPDGWQKQYIVSRSFYLAISSNYPKEKKQLLRRFVCSLSQFMSNIGIKHLPPVQRQETICSY
ncbi:hypothetical protein EVAR_103878_1 [Eumeta japonica]|uniref:Uncharacterized protein n=1 Tax=Eumeta variegata TaxID=151549 RepID=A0A4C2AAQ9_EUMVA|nr:hypothetical protein EVAR_103878_1 [Eumeta japonica]